MLFRLPCAITNTPTFPFDQIQIIPFVICPHFKNLLNYIWLALHLHSTSYYLNTLNLDSTNSKKNYQLCQ